MILSAIREGLLFFASRYTSFGPPKAFRGFVLTRRRPARFRLTGLRPGRYVLAIRHHDRFCAHSADALQVTLIGSPLFGRKAGVSFEGGASAASLGRGSWGSEGFLHRIEFDVPKRSDRLYLEVALRRDRILNVDAFGVTPAWNAAVQTPAEIGALLDTLGARDAEWLIYANIDMNIIDGSSTWLASIADLTSRNRVCLLIAKRRLRDGATLDLARLGRDAAARGGRLVVIDPGTLLPGANLLEPEQAVELARSIDALAPRLKGVLVRGLDEAGMFLSDRQFAGRINAYVTNFYKVEEGVRRLSAGQARALAVVTSQVRRMLVQTPEIAAEIAFLAGVAPPETLTLPPMLPDDLPLPAAGAPATASQRPWRIVYAGKITPDWGVTELLEWVEAARARRLPVEVTVVGDKIGVVGDPARSEAFRRLIERRFAELDLRHVPRMSRPDVLAEMRAADFVWCWRPPRFEDHTLELSTKLVEAAALDTPAVCWPSAVNRRFLGEDYPFFCTGPDDFVALLERAERPAPPPALGVRVRREHGAQALADRLEQTLVPASAARAPVTLFAGHDFKFLSPYVSHLKAQGRTVYREMWEWGARGAGAPGDGIAEKPDVIFCEWGLANAVWYSGNAPSGVRLVVRIHAQEVRQRAEKLARQIVAERVDAFIFVSEAVREAAIAKFGWPREKTRCIPNFLLDEEYRFAPCDGEEGGVTLGMAGIIPQLKRLDRAVDLTRALIERGVAARLRIKGHRPEDLAWMRAPGRREELVWYDGVYRMINEDPRLREAVVFDPWGSDMALWYRGIDVILSPSDSESFHYALADGALTGCLPVVWPWPDATRTYPADWIAPDVEAAAERVLTFLASDPAARRAEAARRRAILIERYGARNVFAMLDKALFDASPVTHG